jgi:tRNA G18 (ribose-2'-O)-methylase SpoU
VAGTIPIDDPEDDRVGDYRYLTDAELRRAIEGDRGIFIAEGPTVVRHLARPDVRARYRIRSVLVTPSRHASLATELTELTELAVPVYVAGQAVMNAIGGFNIHRGALASVDRPIPSQPAALVGHGHQPSVVAVLERINDHENLGSLFRNAAAFGVDAVLLDPGCSDPFYRRSVRVSLGHVLSVPSAQLPALPGGLSLLRDAGYTVVALTPDPSATPLTGVHCAETELRRVALVLGAEGPGLSQAVLAAADQRWRVEMVAGFDSLNVATAAAVVFHHLAGSHRLAASGEPRP